MRVLKTTFEFAAVAMVAAELIILLCHANGFNTYIQHLLGR